MLQTFVSLLTCLFTSLHVVYQYFSFVTKMDFSRFYQVNRYVIDYSQTSLTLRLRLKMIPELLKIWKFMKFLQTIPKAEYEKWARQHLEAESAIEGRDEKLLDSACRMESELELLGATGKSS